MLQKIKDKVEIKFQILCEYKGSNCYILIYSNNNRICSILELSKLGSETWVVFSMTAS
jgi:hypothetical protein